MPSITSTAAHGVERRGKRIGPSNVEAKRAAVLQQAASAASAARHATGVASTVSFLQLMKEAALTGTIPGNAELQATIQAWLQGVVLNSTDELSPTGAALVRDVGHLLSLLQRFLSERNEDELLQRFLHHVHLAGKLIGADVGAWMARGKARVRKQRQLLRSITGGRGKVSLWRSDDRRCELFVGGSHSTIISGQDESFLAAASDNEPAAAPSIRLRRNVAKDARALLQIAQQLITSVDFRQLLAKVQRIAKRINGLAVAEEGGGETVAGREDESASLRRAKPPETSDGGLEAELAGLEREEDSTGKALYQIVHHQRRVAPESIEKLPIIEISERQDEADKKPKTRAEMRREILNDLKEIFQELGEKKEFTRAIRDFYFVLLKLRPETAAAPASQPPAETQTQSLLNDFRYDANFRAAQDELLQLLERLAGGQVSLTPAIDGLRNVGQEAREDYELRDFFGDWRAFLKRCCIAPDHLRYLGNEEYYRRGDFLLRRTEEYLAPQGCYRSHLDEVYDTLDCFIDGLKGDALTKDIGHALNQIIRKDLLGGVDPSAQLSLRSLLSTSALTQPDLVNDLRQHLLPRILRALHAIPLPRIEVISGGSVLVLEDVIVPAEILVPMQVELLTSSHITVNPKTRLFHQFPMASMRHGLNPIEGHETGVQLKFSSLAGQVTNVRFTLQRHEGWPKFSDQGLADLRIHGRGLSILIDLVSHPQSEMTDTGGAASRTSTASAILPAALTAHRVHVKIDRLSLSLHDSLHDSMYRVFNPLIGNVVRRNMERAIRDQILNIVDSLDTLLGRLSKSV